MANQPPSHEDSKLQASSLCLRLQRGVCGSKDECMLSKVCCFTTIGQNTTTTGLPGPPTPLRPRYFSARVGCCCQGPLTSR